MLDKITEYATDARLGVSLTGGPASLGFLGIALPDWLTLFSLVYVVVLLAHKLWVWYREFKTGKIENGQD